MVRERSLLLTLFFALTLTGVSCKKGPIQYTFEGKVVNSMTMTELTGAEITIKQQKINDGLTTGPYTLAGTDETDATGDFSIVFDREKVTNFDIKVEKEDYFTNQYILSSADVTTEDPNVLTEELDPITRIQFDIENFSPSADDELKLILQEFREGCNNCAMNQTYTFTGELDTIITFETTSGTYAHVTYINVSGGSSVIDSIYATPFQTIVYPINY